MRGDTILAITVFVLLAVLVTVKRLATGSVLDRPDGGAMVRLVNIFNLLFLLVVNPLAGALLATGRIASIDPGHVVLLDQRTLAGVRIVGLASFAAGFAIMAWALLTLGRGYQLGGLAPRPGDRLVVRGPYRLVRHPMYAAVLGISFGLACLTQSLIVLAVFAGYLVLIHLLIPIEEAGLRSFYGDRYAVYRRRTKRLVPFVY